jgi:hypothetical protein
VRVDVVRPETPADILTRVSGLSRPPITIVPNRNNAANTTGTWRRVIVPLDLLGNQSNLYVRFTLQSDSNLVAGGWYLDDFAVLQASEICGTLTGSPSAQLVLLGTNFNNNVQASTYSDTNGFFKFGFLPLGDYQLGGMGGTLGGIVLDGTEVCEDLGVTNLPDLVITNIVGLTTKAITWPSSPGVTYRIEYTTDIMSGIWTLLDTVIAGDISYTYVDFFSDPARIYRVVGIPAP